MGLFSWVTQDTHKSIPCVGSKRKTFPVTMTDNKGNSWHETEYQGYGVFGGKDFYELLAEINGEIGREAGIDLSFGDKPFLSPNLTETKNWSWVNRSPQDCPDQGYFYD